MRKIFGILFIVIIIIVYVFFLHRSPVEKIIDSGIKYMAEENTNALMSLVSTEFKGKNGTNYEDIPEILTRVFLMFDHIKVIIVDQEERIVEKNKFVEVDLQFKVVADFDGRRGYIVGTPVAAETITIGLRKENKNWKIQSASRYGFSSEDLKNLQDMI